MKKTTRSILTGALAAGLLLASPLAAGAAVPAAVSTGVRYENAPIPSSMADLTSRATVAEDAKVYADPAWAYTSMSPQWTGDVPASQPFAASGQTWVAIQLPADVAKGWAATHGNTPFNAAGFGYVPAGSVTYTKPPASDYPTSPGSFLPKRLSAYVSEPTVMYLSPSLSESQRLSGNGGSYINPSGPAGPIRFDSSEIFSAGGHKWVAVLAQRGATPSGVGYLPADTGVRVVSKDPATANPVQPTTTPSAPGPSASPTASASASAAPASTTAIAADPASAADGASLGWGWLVGVAVLVLGGLAVFYRSWARKRRGA